MKNKVLFGTGVSAIIAGIAGIFLADKAKKNNKLITFASGVIAISGLLLAAKVFDEEFYPEELEENTEGEESVEE